jgi:Ni,Fe-hydrogenase III large subunit
VDRHIIEELDRLHRVVHELEKAYTHDERFEMNLSELRGITERIADFIEQRNVALSR